MEKGLRAVQFEYNCSTVHVYCIHIQCSALIDLDDDGFIAAAADDDEAKRCGKVEN